MGFSWSPDGAELVAYSMRGEVRILNRSSGEVKNVELGSDARAYFPFWDESQEHLYFTAKFDGEPDRSDKNASSPPEGDH